MNRLKRILKEGKVALGCAVSVNSPDVAEVLSMMGFDFMIYDTEHTPLSIETVQHLMQAAKGTDTVQIVRVAWNDLVLIKRALDIGSDGLIIPWVNNRNQAIEAVKACKYPPRGLRGVGPRRASEYGAKFREYIETADEDVMVIVQIETEEAVKNVEDILSVEGVDAFIIGPADLSTSLGIPLQFNHPKFIEAITRILEAGKKAGVPAGFFAPSAEAAKKYKEMGFQLLNIGSDIGFIKAGGEAVKAIVTGE